MPAPSTRASSPDDGYLADLLVRCRRQEPAAQWALYEHFATRMLAVCRRYAPSLADAEDTLQDAFVKVFERLDAFRSEGSLEGWIRRVVISTAIDAWHRRRLRRTDFELDEIHHLPDPDASILDRLTLAEVRALIDRLPDGYRLVLLLYTVEGYSHAEIGQLLGIGESSSKSQLTRARQRLTALVRAQEREHLAAAPPPDRPTTLPAAEPPSFHPLTALLFQ